MRTPRIPRTALVLATSTVVLGLGGVGIATAATEPQDQPPGHSTTIPVPPGTEHKPAKPAEGDADHSTTIPVPPGTDHKPPKPAEG